MATRHMPCHPMPDQGRHAKIYVIHVHLVRTCQELLNKSHPTTPPSEWSARTASFAEDLFRSSLTYTGAAPFSLSVTAHTGISSHASVNHVRSRRLLSIFCFPELAAYTIIDMIKNLCCLLQGGGISEDPNVIPTLSQAESLSCHSP